MVYDPERTSQDFQGLHTPISFSSDFWLVYNDSILKFTVELLDPVPTPISNPHSLTPQPNCSGQLPHPVLRHPVIVSLHPTFNTSITPTLLDTLWSSLYTQLTLLMSLELLKPNVRIIILTNPNWDDFFRWNDYVHATRQPICQVIF